MLNNILLSIDVAISFVKKAYFFCTDMNGGQLKVASTFMRPLFLTMF